MKEKPMLATDFDSFDHSKLEFPLIAHPSIGGVRILFNGQRAWNNEIEVHEDSLQYIRGDFDCVLDGEFVLTSEYTREQIEEALIKGNEVLRPLLRYFVYDAITPGPYSARLTAATEIVKNINSENIQVVDVKHIDKDSYSLNSLKYYYSLKGYNNFIFRNIHGKYRQGEKSKDIQKVSTEA